MNDDQLSRLIAQANPFGENTVRQLPIDDAESDLLEEIMITAEPTPQRKPSGRRAMVLAAAAVATIAVLASQLLPLGSAQPAPGPAGSIGSAQVRTDGAQRLLLNAPGWKIDQFISGGTFDGGELDFKNGKKDLSVHWRAAELYKSYYDDRADVSAPKPIELLGQQGSVFNYSARDHAAMLPPKGKHFLEIRGSGGTEKEFRELLSKLYVVDSNAWVDALPGSVVKPSEVEVVVGEMLADVPIPAGLNREKLYQGAPNDRYHLGADVSGAVTCLWVDKWVKARKAGDAAGMQASVQAMNTSRNWKVLKEMAKDGDYSAVLWDLVGLIAAGKDPGNYRSRLGCK
ncbi:hypothetical protein [Kribbella deserti]|uniref:DUF1109 domain-containing protein n=1 Tax=Kribbella deserti TaxID=1926257 RepID=A0ABV6QJ62_9ACTN